MTEEVTETRRISDETIQRAVIDLMHCWRDPDTWLFDADYELKRDAAGLLKQVDSEYLYPFINYLGISGADFEAALKNVEKYDRIGRFKRFRLSLYRIWRGLSMPFRLLRGYRY